MEGWMVGKMDRLLDGKMGGWLDPWKDGWNPMDDCIN